MSDIISLDLYYTDFESKKDRRKEFPTEFNDQILQNSTKLLKQVNGLLTELGIKTSDVTSGWRPASVNGKITNAAKKSFHMLGMAVDLLDNANQDLSKLVASRPDLLKKYNLWMEDMNATKGQNTNWTHLDIGIRQDRPSRIFKP
jgi:uncharacterized protein YcbK (DUF882 family)